MPGVLLCCSCIRHIEGPSWLGSYSVDQHVRHLKGHPGWGPTLELSVSGVCWASPSVVQLPMQACRGREGVVMAPPPMHDLAVLPCFHGCPAFLCRHFPAQSPPSHPLIHLSAVNSSPHPGIAPQFLNSHLPASAPSRGVCIPVQGMYGCSKNCLILIPFRLPQIRCFTLSLKCFSSDSDSCPNVGIRPLLQFPHPLRAGPVLQTLLFFPLVPSFYRVVCGSIYSFPLVRYSCPISAGVLHALLCLKVYS